MQEFQTAFYRGYVRTGIGGVCGANSVSLGVVLPAMSFQGVERLVGNCKYLFRPSFGDVSVWEFMGSG